MLITKRRLGAALTSAALILSPLAVTPSADAAGGRDRAPGTAAAGWLSRQLTDGRLQYPPYSAGGSPSNDDGGTADAIISLGSIGRQDTLMGAMSTGLARDIDNYVTAGAYVKVDPGAAGKAAVALRAASRSVTAVGPKRRNLVRDIESTVQSSGRVSVISSSGTVDPTAEWANVLSQAYAVKALAAAHSTLTPKATRSLIGQQCSAGWFRVYFTDTNPDPYTTSSNDTRCDADKSSSPSVDATAVAVAALTPQVSTNASVARAVTRAAAWLAKQQLRNGGFSDGTAAAAGHANANSTGFAGWALGDLGKTVAARRAAVWVRAHQLKNVGTCRPFARKDGGALAYDDAAWSGAQRTDLTANDSQFNSATAQALGVLKWARRASSRPRLLTDVSRPRHVGSTLRVRLSGFAPGTAACVKVGSKQKLVTASQRGRVSARLVLPKRPGRVRLVVKGGSQVVRAVVRVVR